MKAGLSESQSLLRENGFGGKSKTFFLISSIKKKFIVAGFLASILYNFPLIFSCVWRGKTIPLKRNSCLVDPLERDTSLPRSKWKSGLLYFPNIIISCGPECVRGNLIRLHYLKSQRSKLISHLPGIRDHLHLASEWRLELFPHLSCCDFSLFVLFFLCSDTFNSLRRCAWSERARVINIAGSKGRWVIECLLIMWWLFAYTSSHGLSLLLMYICVCGPLRGRLEP